MAKNSCFVSLNIKIDKTYSKLEGYQQAGCLLWMMFLDNYKAVNIVVKIIAGRGEGVNSWGRDYLEEIKKLLWFTNVPPSSRIPHAQGRYSP